MQGGVGRGYFSEKSYRARSFPLLLFDRGGGVVLGYFNANDEVAGSIPASGPQGPL